MALRFYFGASGSGKSTRLHQEIIARSMEHPNTNFFIIVPDQFTMQTQMDLVKAHPQKGIMNIDVLSFSRLCHRILEETGRDAGIVLDDTGKSLVLRQVAGKVQDQMPVVGKNLHQIGYIHEVKSAISEFMQYGIGEKELESLIGYAGSRGLLYQKLKDLKVVYQEFLSYIQEKYVTTEEILSLLCRMLPESALIKNSVIALDGFTGFTPVQYRLIQRLMKLADEVIVTVVMDSREQNPYLPDGEQKLFYLSKKTVSDLRRLADEAGTPLGEDVFCRPEGAGGLPRFAESGQLQHLEKHLFRYPVTSCKEEGDALHLIEASSPREEIRQICIRMRELVRTKGYCYRDMAVIVGDMETYAGHMEAEAEKYGIPVYIDRTRRILMNPFIEHIRSALKLIRSGFSYTTVFHYLRSGLTGFTREEIDCMENYVLACGIDRKSKWQKEFTSMRGISEEDLVRLNEMRKEFLEQLSPLMGKKKETMGERVRRLYTFMEACHLQEKLEDYRKKFEQEGDHVRAREYAQIYRLVVDLLDQMYELLGEEVMEDREFADILDAGFGEIQVGTIPQSVDQVVVGDMERSRLKEVKVLFFAGINDGNIPKHGGKGGIISDMEREFLQNAEYELAPTPRQQMFIQRLYLYLIMTKPSRYLYLSWSKVSNDGKSLRPAYLVDLVKKLFPGMETEAPEWKPLEEQMETRQAGLEYLADLLRAYAGQNLKEEEQQKLFSMYRMYARDEDYRQEIERLTEAAFAGYQESPLGNRLARLLYGSLLAGSVSRMEQHAACAYAYFLKYGLELKEREVYEFEPVDMGNIFHHVLCQFALRLKQEGESWREFREETAERILREILQQISGEYEGEVLLSNARNAYTIERMYRVLKRTVMTLQYQLKKGLFLPQDFEFSFEQTDSLDQIDVGLTGDERLRLQGRIDRVDVYEKDNKVYVKIIDYKSGKKRFHLAAVYHGLELQLVTYMNAVKEKKEQQYPGRKIIPAAMLYYQMKDPMIQTEEELTEEEINEKLRKELKNTGVVNGIEGAVEALDQEFSSKSDVVPVERKKDGSYSLRSDILGEEDLEVVMDYARQKIRQMGLEILRGEIGIYPCRQSTGTACDYCVFAGICGFDSRVDGYHYHEIGDPGEEVILKKMRAELKKEEKGENSEHTEHAAHSEKDKSAGNGKDTENSECSENEEKGKKTVKRKTAGNSENVEPSAESGEQEDRNTEHDTKQQRS